MFDYNIDDLIVVIVQPPSMASSYMTPHLGQMGRIVGRDYFDNTVRVNWAYNASTTRWIGAEYIARVDEKSVTDLTV